MEGQFFLLMRLESKTNRMALSIFYDSTLRKFMLFDRYALGGVELTNRIVMAPMTRSRAVEENTPNALMAEYYGQRATAGSS